MSLIRRIKNNMEPRKWLRLTEFILFVALLVASLTLFAVGIARVNRDAGAYNRPGNTETMRRLSPDDPDYAEDYDADENRICTVTYRGESGKICRVDYSYAEWEALPEDATITAYIYTFESGAVAAFDHPAHEPEIRAAVKDYFAEEASPIYNTAIVLVLLALSLGVVTFFARQFSTYEKIWFLSIMVLAAVFAIAMPEEEANGVSGIWIMLLYLLDTFLNILCELLISKQSRWNFIVSVAVEITEILICIVLMYRFATMLTTLFFWLPIDILSFINWSKHPDREKRRSPASVPSRDGRRCSSWPESPFGRCSSGTSSAGWTSIPTCSAEMRRWQTSSAILMPAPVPSASQTGSLSSSASVSNGSPGTPVPSWRRSSTSSPVSLSCWC